MDTAIAVQRNWSKASMSANTRLCQPLCDCGSGETRYPLKDGYDIFLTYACDHCRKQKLGRYRPDILERYDTDEQIEDDY
jgi:hypothetical protein